MNDAQKIEALLFYKSEPVSIKEISKILAISEDLVLSALNSLEESLKNRGVRLLRMEDVVELRTAPEASLIIEKMIKEDRIKDLGKAGLETLAIILYRGPISRRDIDYIRGVNSSFVLRNLLIRGLIERTTLPEDKRSFAYKTTFDLMGHLGIEKVTDLPEFSEIEKEIESFRSQEDEGMTDISEVRD